MARALIVDDNSENRYLLQCILSANGFDVDSATNGREALDHAEKQPPDLVLSDILMPVMDGFALCRNWKQSPTLSHIPFIVYTATYTQPKDEEFALSLGADLFIVKPAEPPELMRLVQQVLERRKRGQLPANQADALAEAPYLRQYNEVLIRKLEDKLLEVERANQRLLIKEFAIASSKAGIAMADLTGRLEYVNAAFVRLWRKASEELVGQSLQVFFPEARQRESVMQQLRESRYWSGELTGHGAGGKFTALVEIHTVLDTEATPLCLMIRCTDITEQERMREQLQRAQRMESLSQFAAGIAHDLNNLLTMIFANLNLSDEAPASNSAPLDRAALVSAFERAREMSRRLLAFGKGTTAPRQVVSVRTTVEESCRLSLVGSKTELRLDFVEPLYNVSANATELSEVFCNIAINARQVMGDSGMLQVTANNRWHEGNASGELCNGQYVVVEFRDNGPGIDVAMQQRIFEPFFTSRRDGSGLGLAMCRAIINSYGGKISLSSSSGAGATFEVWLPATEQPVTNQALPVKLVPEKGSGRVLVLDDEELICRLAARHLERLGYEVTTATTGEAVIALYEKARAEGRAFDLFILDLGIHQGMGGVATLAALRAMDADIVALACTGEADETAAAEVKAQGFVGLLGKPFWGHELASMVKATMATRRRG
jgi:PAS domain S-box-containing protein